MEYFNKLLVKDRAELTQDESMFLGLHEVILYTGSLASSYMVEFAKRLKEMRDCKLYEKVGFVNFGEYVENAVNIKQRQAYKYIEVYEKYSEEFLKAHGKIVVTKLLMLSNLGEEEKEQVIEEIKEKDITVEELKKIVEEKEKKINQLEIDLGKVDEKKIAKANEKADKAKKELEKAIKEIEEYVNRYVELVKDMKVAYATT